MKMGRLAATRGFVWTISPLATLNQEISMGCSPARKAIHGTLVWLLPGLAVLASYVGVSPARADILYVSLDGNNTIATYDTTALTPTPTTFVSTGPNSNPVGLAFDSAGNLYTANNNNHTIGKFTPGGVASVFASASSGLNFPVGLAIDAFDNVFAGNGGGNGNILKLTPGGVASVFATSSPVPYGLAFDSSGNLFAINFSLVNPSIVKYTAGGVVAVFATSMLSEPTDIAFDSFGNLYVTNYLNNTIVKFTPAGVGTLFANTGGVHPYGIAIDSSNNLFVTNEADTILKFTPDGVKSVFAINAMGPSFLAIRPSAVPEPSSFLLVGLGAMGMIGIGVRRRIGGLFAG
jgi:sugar lactone lactonase YvrE